MILVQVDCSLLQYSGEMILVIGGDIGDIDINIDIDIGDIGGEQCFSAVCSQYNGEMILVQFASVLTVFTVQRAVFSVQCSMFSVQCSLLQHNGEEK